MAEITQLALTEGWRLSEFVRALVFLGAAANWLALESKENARALGMRAELRQLSDRVAKLGARGKQGHAYASRSVRDTHVIGLILPIGVAHMMESYANVRGLSKNDLCGSLLIEGLMTYMTCEKNLLQTIVPADRLPKGNTVTET